nr:hypothetical protein [uncultured Fretibacterium sp.]
MAQFVLELPQELRERIEVRSGEVKQKPERLMLMAIEQYLEDLEDAEDAMRLSEAVARGEEKVYTAEEVRRRLGLGN